MSTHLRGAGGAPGIVLGRAVRYLPAAAAATAAISDPEADLRRFAVAQASAAAHLRELAEQWRGDPGALAGPACRRRPRRGGARHPRWRNPDPRRRRRIADRRSRRG